MAWFKVDDKFHSHTKVMQCSDAAIGVWAKLGSWCAEQLNGGRVTREALRHFRVRKSLATELVAVGLWIQIGEEYQFHDWDDHQPSKDQVLARRRATKERVARFRNGVTGGPSDSTCNAVTNAVGNASPVPSRTREELRTPPRAPARGEQDAVQVGADFMIGLFSRHYHPSDWREQLARIGLKPASERAKVLASIQADAYCRANPTYVTPSFVLKQWDQHLEGNPPPKITARSNGRYAGPSRVANAAEYEADKTEKAPWE